jgi:hypothetical protein
MVATLSWSRVGKQFTRIVEANWRAGAEDTAEKKQR